MMKKCSNPKCGLEGEWKFCQECGGKMIDLPTKPILSSIVIICDGDDESGSPCGEELKSTQKFCTSCGKQVDIKLLEVQTPDIERCGGCGAVCTPGKKFCPECGFKVKPMAKQATDAPPSLEKQTSVVDMSDPVSVATTSAGESQKYVQHYQPASNQTSPSHQQHAEESDLNVEVRESATGVEHLDVKDPDLENTLQDNTEAREKRQGLFTDKPNAADVQQGEVSSPEPMEEHFKPSKLTEEEDTKTNKPEAEETQSQEQVNFVCSKTTHNIEDDAMNTSDLPWNNKLCVVNMDDGNDERKQESIMQGDPRRNIGDANATANINNNNYVSSDVSKGGDSVQHSLIFKGNVSPEVGHEKAENATVESQLKKSIKDINITNDETINKASDGETFKNDLSDKVGNGSKDDSADSDSSESEVNDDDTEETKHGGKGSKKNHMGGTKAKRVKKRERKKEKMKEKQQSMHSDHKEEDDKSERITRSMIIEENQKSGKADMNAKEKSLDEQYKDTPDKKGFVFGQSKMKPDSETGFKSSERTTPSFFLDNTNSINSAKQNNLGSSASEKVGNPDKTYNTRSNGAATKSASSSANTETAVNTASNTKTRDKNTQSSKDQKTNGKRMFYQ
ncbi:hypothetical protein MAR_017162 [Mya arenaria]|uniref:DZANK-type domain-containing protein n=1 Tax=Mya arenaria TaxID=6604 RepID=A0ABY7EFJ8_MYAAR|nr:hypothetical protein MAR_017162 [Mya arenaria]